MASFFIPSLPQSASTVAGPFLKAATICRWRISFVTRRLLLPPFPFTGGSPLRLRHSRYCEPCRLHKKRGLVTGLTMPWRKQARQMKRVGLTGAVVVFLPVPRGGQDVDGE